ncbi:DUF424 domain-containing protein [Methanoregula sp.]|uniref:DUF424 domain-containing protein n=1 Tax=Methanoregula sp. TaxID=2052170 RepID=UPI002369E5E7|nr:DUF424 domain-containing protein [Methanoregula sp.]MDD1686855.1 DUF424 domain-containing protein [Methanoregula sp.]
MFLKIHRSRETADVVAVCDRELINTTITNDTMKVIIHDSFYGKTPVTEEEVREALKNAGNVNLIGERTIRIAIEMGLLTKADCIMIGNVPHAQIYQL